MPPLWGRARPPTRSRLSTIVFPVPPPPPPRRAGPLPSTAHLAPAGHPQGPAGAAVHAPCSASRRPLPMAFPQRTAASPRPLSLPLYAPPAELEAPRPACPRVAPGMPRRACCCAPRAHVSAFVPVSWLRLCRARAALHWPPASPDCRRQRAGDSGVGARTRSAFSGCAQRRGSHPAARRPRARRGAARPACVDRSTRAPPGGRQAAGAGPLAVIAIQQPTSLSTPPCRPPQPHIPPFHR
jgi:hypothetical protein